MNYADEQSATRALQPVLSTVQTYLDGLYAGDVELLRQAFHPEASLYSATDGELVHLDLPGYLEIVAGRPSPAHRGDPRNDEVVAIDAATPTSAHVRVRNQYLPKRFTDDLTVVRLGERWWIVSKVWHYERG